MILIHRLDREPELVTRSQELTAGPVMPGFRVAASKVLD
jgi:hypothetical protein